MRRGEVWKADLPFPIKRRPVFLLSRDSMPAARQEITVTYLPSTIRNSQAEVRVPAADDGVDRDCVVNLDSVNTIPKNRLLSRVCTLSAAKMEEVAEAIRYALDLT
jgi:mRNA interferase MazF